MAKGSKKKTSPSPAKTNNSTTSDIDDGTADLEDNSPITKNDLHSALKLHLNPTIDKLQAQLDAVALIAENALKLAEQMEIRLKKSEEAQLALKAENNELKYKLKTNSNHIKLIEDNVSSNQHSLEERIEDRTNRQLRKTLVFRGIPEQPSTATDGAETATHKTESWQETKDLLADQISEICALPKPDAAAMLERAHRSAPNPRYKGTAPRPIYVALFDWNQSQLCIEKFRQHNITNKNSKIMCEQKYGPITTQRRNQAMMMRKELKDSGEIVAGYVAFPARLMAKTSHREGSKYTMVRDFSREPVTLGKRD